METINKTVMEEWAESSVEFSGALKKLLDEFGFKDVTTVKAKICQYFPTQYLTIMESRGYKFKQKISYDFPSFYQMAFECCSAIGLAKAILFAAALLETTDMEKIIKWANI